MTYQLNFITPLFSRGSYEIQPEIRPSSIRGQLHWWFRALGGTPQAENAVFGSVHGTAKASPIVVRVSTIQAVSPREIPTLPHKSGGPAAAKWAFPAGTSFQLHILERLGGISDSRNRELFTGALETWLLVGALGLRATRGGGNFRSEGLGDDTAFSYPKSFTDYEERCRSLLSGSSLKFALLTEPYDSAELARKDITNTLGGPRKNNEKADLEAIRWPLGKIDPSPRKTSPLRLRVVKIGPDYRIAAVWDGRSNVTGNQDSDLLRIANLLQEHGKPIGSQLVEANW